ncbi:hypothetical protein J7T55_006280 [Diaporthe amygdali]|uniref:uncharacterized protein n=1 Tax=Phomopsis amygdali TaxID=1214568 RepID=UPI0022FE1B0B|nr:uncharacterized protein J7T55_006280 [Diaporthe amygdali]KAJ0124937.1 hypothetical protein J7T55_006280 [Diaporthe amygdali]
MASQYGSNKQNKSLPAMLKCAVDGKMEKRDMFSNNMLKKRTFNPNAQITCRKHTGGAVTELLCSSCRKHKPLDFFSNAERKVTGGQRCRACIEWLEGDQPDYVPLPAPNSVRDHEEKRAYKADGRGMDDYDDDEDDYYVTEAQGDAFSDDDASWAGRTKAPKGANTAGGLTANNLKNLDNYGGSHSASSRGDERYHASSAPTDSASNADTESTARPHNPRRFNAYGPNGQVQRRQVGTAASETSGTSVSTQGSIPGRKDWARPATRKTAPALPRHMEYENPDTVGHYAYDDDDSSDGC